MGYYTVFHLNYSYVEGFNTNKDDEIIRKDICHSLSRITDWMNEGDVEEIMYYGCEYKWNNWESDMKELAKEYPNIHFTLEGEGEEQGDIGWLIFGEISIAKGMRKLFTQMNSLLFGNKEGWQRWMNAADC